MHDEPVLTAAGVSAALTAVLVAVGVHVDDNLTRAISAVCAIAVPLVAAWFARKRVWPDSKVSDTGTVKPDPEH